MGRLGASALAAVTLAVLAGAGACGRASRSGVRPSAGPAARPWVLLVTLDTTRADAVGPEARGVETPAFNARAALDRVTPGHPEYAMALFKRAQVSVLLGEPDSRARIDAARRHADATRWPLIESERLFRGPR